VLGGGIDLGLINRLINGVLYKDRPSLFALKELGHRDEAKRTYSRTVLDIREDEEGRTAIEPRNRNPDGTNTLKIDATANTPTDTKVTAP
jgi:hypothetical protein